MHHLNCTVVTRHMFETIDDPVANGRCTDYITYPYFQADYRTNHDRSGAIQQGGGLGNWYVVSLEENLVWVSTPVR